MKISMTYAEAGKQPWFEMDVEEGTTVEQAVEQSGLLQKFPQIDLDENRFGIFGRLVKGAEVVKEGDRVEIYRPITADPETVPRRDEE